ncbi:uncharacterized protein LOC126995252 [Eriocheir sinensis]|uniref:uncharacterized protein LOC126995252 n=1 Tax=Eriocheir sinensis TaxID=95602 RepID=UPI0021C8715E|nr:uncharacterized protein LOC126995252 [Eriocheir sinensis]
MGGAGGCHGASIGFDSLGAFTVRMLVGALVTFVLVIVVCLVAFWQAGCPKGGFQCRDGQCLARSRRCDNENNCSEREDEEDCMLPDGVDVKSFSFPSTSNAPCHMCVCPSPHRPDECLLPSPPHPSLAQCRLTPRTPTGDEAGVRSPRNAFQRLHQTSTAGEAREKVERRRGGVEVHVRRRTLEERWLVRRKVPDTNGYRVMENETVWETREKKSHNKMRRNIDTNVYQAMGNETGWKLVKRFVSDKKCKENISERKGEAREERVERSKNTLINVQDGRRLAHAFIKTPETVQGSSLYQECAPRCPPPPPPPPRGEEQARERNCQHTRGGNGERTIYPAVFLNPFHKTKPLTPRHVDERHFRSRGMADNLRGVSFGVRGKKDIHGTRTNKHLKEKAQYEFLHTGNRVAYTFVTATSRPRGRRKRQRGTEGTVRGLDHGLDATPTDLKPPEQHTSGDMDFDNTATTANLPGNITLDSADEDEEEDRRLNEQQVTEEGEGPESRSPEVVADRPDAEVQDSCHCELSNYLTCVGTYLRIISDRIVGEIKHLTLRNDDAPILEDKALMRHDTLETLSLTSGGLITLPLRFFVNHRFLEHLYLTGNRIEVVEEESCIGLEVLKVLFINRNELTYIDLDCFRHTPALQDLNMGHNKLTLDGQSFPHLPHLTSLYLNNNLLTNINGTLLASLPFIRTLDLRDNLITTVHPKAFSLLTHLRFLMMSGNRVTSVAGLFRGLNSLAMLKLEKLDLHDINTKNFRILPSLKFVYFDTFRYCRYVPTVAICLPNFDGVTSTEDLLSWRTLRVAVWLMALLTIIANGLVIFCRAISRKDNKILKLFIKNLAVADLLMGVYLVMIGVQDAATRGRFNFHALQWADSYMCVFAGALAMVSSETSVFIISFMSLERYLYISEAFHDRTLSLRGARLCLAAIWLTSVSLAFFPILWIRSFYGNNSVCFPLYINEPYLAGWQYSAFIFLGLNFVSMLVILASYVGLFLNIRGTRLSTSRTSDEMNFAFRFFFIVVTNCLCWLPIMCVKVAALAHVEVHQGVYAWLVVLVLPINSAVNPALYTFSTSQFQLQMTSAVTIFRRLQQRHNSDTEALRHSSTRTGGSHHHPHHLHNPPHAHAHSPLEPHPVPNNLVLMEVRDIHLKNLPSPESVATLSPRDLRNGLLMNIPEAPPLPEESPPPDEGGGDETSDVR